MAPAGGGDTGAGGSSPGVRPFPGGGGAALAAGLAFAAALAVVYGPTLAGMARQWGSDPNYSHGILVPLVSAYFLWRGRRELASVRPASSLWGLAGLAAGLALFLLGRLSGEYFSMRASLLPVLGGTVLFAAGWGALRAVALPLGYLAFMIPLPYLVYDAAAFPLKLFVSRVAAAGLRLLGVGAVRDGNIITVGVTSLEVADACSGMRSLVSLLALAVALAWISHRDAPRRAAVIALAVPIAVLANAARVIFTGVLAGRYGPQLAQGAFHEFAGAAVFALAMALLLGASSLLGRGGGT